MTDEEILSDILDELKEIREENQKLRDDYENVQEENRELRQELKELRQTNQKPDAPSNEEIVRGFLSAKNYKDTTERPYKLCIKYFREYLDDKPLSDVTEAEALDFAANWSGQADAEESVAKSTMEAYLRRVKVLYDWMVEQEWGPDENLIANALEEFKNQHSAELRRSGQHNGTALQPYQYTALLKWNRQPRIYALLMLAVKTGLRRKELAWLKIDDLDLDNGKLYNRSPKGVGDTRIKKNSADEKLLDNETVAALRDWLDTRSDDSDWLFPNGQGGHISPMTISRWVGKATDRVVNATDDDEVAAAIKDFTPHDARRCFTTWLNHNGCDRDVVKALRGDADGDMVTLYTQYGEDYIREEYESAMPKIGF